VRRTPRFKVRPPPSLAPTSLESFLLEFSWLFGCACHTMRMVVVV